MRTHERSNRLTLLLFVGMAVAAAFVACGSDDVRLCRVDTDCESGRCLSNGECAGIAEDGGQPDDGGLPDAGPTDGGETTPDGGEADGGPSDGGDPPTCRPNLDGVIDRDEVIYFAGLTANFRVAAAAAGSPGLAFDTAGSEVDGVHTWDLDTALTGDHDKHVTLVDPTSKWFGEEFPDATYVSPMDDETADAEDVLYGIFKATPEALLLLGYASEKDGLYRTRLRHDPPVPMLQFPLAVGETWSTEADVVGLYNGTVVSYDEDWTSTVDLAGEAVTPYGTFEVLRVRTVMEKTVYWGMWPVTNTYRTFLFESECFGTVASIKSLEDEASVEFTQASEVTRIAP